MARATCNLHLLLHENAALRKQIAQDQKKKTSTTSNDAITKEFVEDLQHRVKETKNQRLRRIFDDYLGARVEVSEAKLQVDPKLGELRDIANSFLRVL